MIPLDYRDKLCRVCKKPGLTPFAREHVACTRERELALQVKPSVRGAPTYPCCTSGCERRVRVLGNKCVECVRKAKLAARPPRLCRKCQQNEIPWMQGCSVCDECRAPETRRSKLKLLRQLDENPFELEAMQMAGECMTRDQIAHVIGVSVERARQIEVEALRKFTRNWWLMFGSSLRDEVDYAVAEVEEFVECD